MSDVEADAGFAGDGAKEGSTAPASNVQTDLDRTNGPGGEGAEGDSEAETLIESPEKKKNIVDSAPRLQASTAPATKGLSQIDVSGSDGKNRKRKRVIEQPQEDVASSPKSSRRSSPLSSPQPHFSDESDSDASRKNGRKVRDRAGHESDQDTPRKFKLRKRRPSDIVPGGARGVESGRRETRSATYPRHSSAERSVSPKREHRRVASTQLSRKGRPLNISTKRNFSSDRRSSSISTSPQPSHPLSHKHTSHDHDTMSPAKTTGPRKFTDKNGRTFLARACNNDDLATARLRYLERPQDLNIADNAGNTPLQIAALEGFVDIVRFLLEKGCEIDTRNIDRETPLIDAVENGHFEVVKLLLEYGANPRLGNAKGDEPYELVKPDDKHYSELRKLIADTKEHEAKRRRSDDQVDTVNRDGSSRAASAASQRDSPPPLGPRSPPTLTSRRRTGRSESTRNDLLWQANTPENLTRLAGKGDVQGVASILNVLTKADTDSLIAAARAGHEEVLQLLLGMGNPDPDPDPIRSADLKQGYNTPMLAAIGRGNPDVIRLLVDQSGFNPTREHQGRKYYEISQQRRGVEWQAEHDILKAAYDRYSSLKPRSHGSPRKSRDLEKEKPRRRRESSSPAPAHARSQMKSPLQPHKGLPMSKDTGEKHKRHLTRDKIPTDRSIAVTSDREPSEQRKIHKTRRSQSDLPTLHPETMSAGHKRRRLVNGKEHRRRQSFITDESSNESNDAPVKEEGKEKQALKRSRDSLTPDQGLRSGDVETTKLTIKKRRTVLDNSSPEESRTTPRKKMLRKPSESTTQRGDLKALSIIKETSTIREKETLSRDESSAIAIDLNEVVKLEAVNTEGTGEEAPVEAQTPLLSDTDKIMQDIDPITVQKTSEQTASADDETSASIEAQIEAEPEVDEAMLAEKRAVEEAARKAEEEAAAEAAEEQRKADELAARRKADEEAAARKKEEEERQERLRREAEERQRRLDEQKRREFLENERRRREALPGLLCKCALLLDQGDPTVKSHSWLKKFLPLFTVRTRQIDPTCGPDVENEEWIPNFQVAGLLATKDLNLRQYTSLDRRPVSPWERRSLWKVARNMLAFDYDVSAFNTPVEHALERERETEPKFSAMEDLFWVKLSDFEDQIFRHSHLLGLYLKRQRISIRQPQQSPSHQQPVKPSTPPIANGISPYLTNVPSANGVFGNGSLHAHGYFQQSRP